jgi:hypothetical protein
VPVREQARDRLAICALDRVGLVPDQQLAQTFEVLGEFLTMKDSFLVEWLKGDQRIAQQLFGDRDVADRFVEQDAVRLFDQIEVCAQAILLVLLLEALEITEVRMDTDQDLEQTGSLRRAPTLLSADDLVAPTLSSGRFYLQQRLVATGLDRATELVDEVNRDVDARLDRAGLDQVDWNHCETSRKAILVGHAASPLG